MKTWLIMFSICCMAVGVMAKTETNSTLLVLTEKRFQIVEKTAYEDSYLIDSSTGKLWVLDSGKRSWTYLGKPADTQPKREGTYTLIIQSSGEVILLDTKSGKSWWNDGTDWEKMERPTRED